MADQKALEYLQEEKFLDFNNLVESTPGPIDLTGAHLRAFDLRKANLKTANMAGAYLRATDLRGLDLSEANLIGVSLKDTKISGVLFPASIPAAEIMMSIEHGTRLRANP